MVLLVSAASCPPNLASCNQRPCAVPVISSIAFKIGRFLFVYTCVLEMRLGFPGMFIEL